jgi:hypothetical protein
MISGAFLICCIQVSYAQTIMPFQNKRELWGYADSRGKTVLPARYGYAEAFVDSFAVVTIDKNYRIIKSDGSFLTDSIYDLIWPFQQGYFLVKKGAKYAYLDRSGNIVRNFWFDRALLFTDNYAEAWQGNASFLMYRDGNIFPYGGNRLQRLSEPLNNLPQEMPGFPGGNRLRHEIISQMLVSRFQTLPSGMVSIQAVVEKDGSLSEIIIINSLGEIITEQVIWALENMPPWIPARQNGEPVRTKVNFAISFTNTDKS